MEYPALVYKTPGPFTHGGGTHDYIAVNDDAELEQRLAEGWFKSMLEAIEGKTSASEQEEEDNSAPTRAEMEAKAKELGIAFDGRTSDAKLLGKINDALNAG
jgi:hypothetical protein